MKNLYEIIQDRCNEQGITITKLEQECGLSQNSIKKWDDDLPKTIESLVKIAKYLGVSTDYLLGLSEK